MKSQIIKVKHHIVDRSQLEKYECSICYDLALLTHRCQGPCQRPYCLKCIGRIKATKNCCPNKCSQPFLTEAIPELNINFSCPSSCYSSSPFTSFSSPFASLKCTKTFPSVLQFQAHYQTCMLIKASDRQQILNRKQFRCCKGHPLTIFTLDILNQLGQHEMSFYQTAMNQLCIGCGNRNLCRAICIECTRSNLSKGKEKHIYCIECRTLPLNQVKCPIGHYWTKKGIAKDNFGSVCDVCGVSGSIVGTTGYVEHQCDIFVCQPCFANLPKGCGTASEEAAKGRTRCLSL